MYRSTGAAAAFFALQVVGCSPSDASPRAGREADSLAILQIHDEHVEGVNSGDAEAVLRGFADDVVYMAPDQPSLIGSEAVGDAVRPVYEQMTFELAMPIRELVVHDDVAVEWGDLRNTMRPRDGSTPTILDGKYMYVYERSADGSWRIAHAIYNSNVPAAGALP